MTKSPLLTRDSVKIPTLPDTETAGDPVDKRIKKPPPYHIAAVLSRHAADFTDGSMEVPSSPPRDKSTTENAEEEHKQLPSLQQVATIRTDLQTVKQFDNFKSQW